MLKIRRKRLIEESEDTEQPSPKLDKWKTWKRLKEDILETLKANDLYNFGMTMDIGPQHLHTFRHRNNMRCFSHYQSKFGEVFTVHYIQGAKPRISVWTVQPQNKDGLRLHTTFKIDFHVTTITFVPKHRVYIGFCSDLTLRIFTDANSGMKEVSRVQCSSTILCLLYNKDSDAIYAGGIGTVDEWRIQGSEHSASVEFVQTYSTTLTRQDWVNTIITERDNNQMYALHGSGVSVINLRNRKEIHSIKKNQNDGPLKCCCYYALQNFFLTGEAGGKIRVYHASSFTPVQAFQAHHGEVTSMEPHYKDAMVFTSSVDGTIRIWRMATFTLYARMDVGEKIQQMGILGPSEFYFRTQREVMIYNLNQNYQMFLSLGTSTYTLKLCSGKGKPSRILASLDDGSVRLFSPFTGATLNIIYPMPTFQILSCFAHDLHQEKIYTVLTRGQVIVYNSTKHPCIGEELWVPYCNDDQVTTLVLVTVEFTYEEEDETEEIDIDNLVFAGLNNGQLILLDAVRCVMPSRVQAHEGSILCLESYTHLVSTRLYSSRISRLLVSAGADLNVRLWLITINVNEKQKPPIDLVPLLKVCVDSVPTHVCMLESRLCVGLKMNYPLGKRWGIRMYKVRNPEVLSTADGFLKTEALMHSPDQDHINEMTALENCPVVRLALTAGKDGFIKIWNMENEMIREMNFGLPIFAACFANERGDILLGQESHIVAVPVLSYYPLDHLDSLVKVRFSQHRESIREKPREYDHTLDPCIRFEEIPKYPLDLFERRRLKLEEELQKSLEEGDGLDSNKFVVYSEYGRVRVINKALASRLDEWVKAKFLLKLDEKASPNPEDIQETKEVKDIKPTISISKKASVAESQQGPSKKEVSETDLTNFDYQGNLHLKWLTKSQTTSSSGPLCHMSILQALAMWKTLGPVEMKLLQDAKLLERDPIIAPDGFIPNSVIRKKLKPKPYDVPKKIERFQPKPVLTIEESVRSRIGAKSGKPMLVEQAPHEEVRYIDYVDTPSPVQSEVSSLSAVSVATVVSVESVQIVTRFRRPCHSDKSSPVEKEAAVKEAAVKEAAVKEAAVKEAAVKEAETRPGEVRSQHVAVTLPPNRVYYMEDSWEDTTCTPMTDVPEIGALQDQSDEELSESPSISGSTEKRHWPKKTARPPPPGYVLKSQLIQLQEHKDDDLTSKTGAKGGKLQTQEVAVEKTKTGTGSKLTAELAEGEGEEEEEGEEDSFSEEEVIHPETPGRTEKKSYAQRLLDELMAENWMPEPETTQYNSVVKSLVTVLDNNNPVIYKGATKYVAKLFVEVGDFPDEELEESIEIMSKKVSHPNQAIRRDTVACVGAIGGGREDVLHYLLPTLIDKDDNVREAAASAIHKLTGASDKAGLLSFLENAGLMSSAASRFDCKEDMDHALQILEDRLRGSDSQVFDGKKKEMIGSWVQATMAGVADEELKKEDLEQLFSQIKENTGSPLPSSAKLRGVKEQSFQSDVSNRKSAPDFYDTSGRNTMYNDMPSTPFSSDPSDFIFSRGVSMHDPKSAGLHSEVSNFNARMDLMDRSGASVLPMERYDPETPLSDNELSPPYNLEMEKTDLTSKTQSARSVILLTERTMTNLSLVGPLPNFVRGNTERDREDVSVDSAFSASEYAQSLEAYSYLSEGITISHLAESHHSSKVSEVSDDEGNQMFDIERVAEPEPFELDMDQELEDWVENLDSPTSLLSDSKPVEYRGKPAWEEEEEEGEEEGREGVGEEERKGYEGEDEEEAETYKVAETQDGTEVDEGVVRVPPEGHESPELIWRLKKKDSFEEYSAPPLGSRQRGSVDYSSTEKPAKVKKGETQELRLVDLEDLPGADTAPCVRKSLSAETELESDPGTARSDRRSSEPTLTELELLSEAVTDVSFTPKHAFLYKHYEKKTSKKSFSPLKKRNAGANSPASRKSGESSPRGKRNENSPVSPSGASDRAFLLQKLINDARPGIRKDSEVAKSDQLSLSNTSSLISPKVSTFQSQIMERLSYPDSGIGPDISDFSLRGPAQRKRSTIKADADKSHVPYTNRLSPVKSDSDSRATSRTVSTPHREEKKLEHWRQFFELPNAVERRQMETVKREMKQGKLKHTTLPPISYFDSDIPMLPGEAGTRLLQTVVVGDKEHHGDGRHRVESVPGKLSVHTKNENQGQSSFGIIQMKWTTSVPTVKDYSQPPQRLPKQRHPLLQEHSILPPVFERYNLARMQTASTEASTMNLPDNLSQGSEAVDSQQATPSLFQWQHPLPPPPAKESRTCLPDLKHHHENYCKYYKLVKKKLHLYTSQKEETAQLPRVVVRQLNRERQARLEAESRQSSRKTGSRRKKYKLRSDVIIPPIKLGQLVQMV